MITRQYIASRKNRRKYLWWLIIACGLIASYLTFISILSIWVGIAHMSQTGFWVPILAGTVSLIGIFLISFRLITYILSYIKKGRCSSFAI